MRLHTFLRSAWLALAVTAVASSVPAQLPCETWQEGFGAPGPDTPFLDFVTFDDGSGPALYTCGNFRVLGDEPLLGVARWNGSRWVQFGTGATGVSKLAVFDDGSGAKLVATGGVPAGVATWTGTQWAPLAGIAPENPFDVRDLASFDDGSGPALYLSGSFRLMPSGPVLSVVRWKNGSWSDASTGIVTSSYSNKPLAAFDAGSGPQLYLGVYGGLLRWNGSTWTDAVAGLTNVDVNALATYTSGGSTALYLATQCSWSGSPWWQEGIARFDGTSLTTVGSGLESDTVFPYSTALAVHDFGSGPRLVVGGEFDGAGGIRSRGLVSWDGSAWGSLMAELIGHGPTALASFDDGSGPALFASGPFTAIGGVLAPTAARLQHGAWSGFARGLGLSVAPQVLRSVIVDGERSLVAGGGLHAGGTPASTTFARFDGTRWHPLGNWFMGEIHDLIDADLGAGSRLYAGGGGTYTAQGVVAWDGSNWAPLGYTLGGVHSLVAFDDGTGTALYAAGEMQGSPVKRWNGVRWELMGTFPMYSHPRVDDLCVHDDGSGPALYASGFFGTHNGVDRWNGTSWEIVGASLSLGGGDFQLNSFDDGSGPQLVLNGVNHLPTGSFWLTRWDGSSWSGIPTQGQVWESTIVHDGTTPRLCIARGGWNGTRVSVHIEDKWVDLGVLDGGGRTLASFDGDDDGVPELFVGGFFWGVEGIPSVNIARYAFCGTSGTTRCAGDGSATACPCGNAGATGHGCANSVHASGARLSNGGLASLSGDTLRLDADALTGSFAIFAQGTTLAGGAGVPFQDGLLCTGGVVTRLGSAPISGGTVSFPAEGGAPLSQLGSVTLPGQRRVYQAIYRNQASFCTNGSANATNGLQVTWSL